MIWRSASRAMANFASELPDIRPHMEPDPSKTICTRTGPAAAAGPASSKAIPAHSATTSAGSAPTIE